MWVADGEVPGSTMYSKGVPVGGAANPRVTQELVVNYGGRNGGGKG